MSKLATLSRLPKLSLLIALASGCSHWPEHGQGGFAEHDAAPFYPIEIDTKSFSRNDTIDRWQALRLDVELTRAHLDNLIHAGANICFPAQVHHLKHRQTRIERELAGGLAYDASVDLIVQRKHLARLREQVRIAAIDANCDIATAPKLHSKATLSRIESLLNGDNQFAHDSEALNPKYATNLANAAQWLAEHTDVRLIIEGHTDNTGTETHNRALASQRGNEVARFLIEHGISASRMTVINLASTEPFSQMQGPEHRLVNRRVRIVLVQAVSTDKGLQLRELSKGGI